MDMNKSFVFKKENAQRVWKKVDASGKVLGRLATEVADILRGKDKPNFTPHADSGDYVVVVNCDQIKLTGDKWEQKIYKSHSGWMGGLKERTAMDMFKKDPGFIVQHAVKGMLPKNKLSRQVIKKLKVYSGSEHPHKAQLAS